MPNGDDEDQSVELVARLAVARAADGQSSRVVYVETAPLERQPEDDPAFPP
jgi:hypothetical protein